MHRSLAIAVMSFRRLLRMRLLAVALVLAALVPGGYSAILIPMIVAGRADRVAEVQSMLPIFFTLVVGIFGVLASIIAIIVGVTLMRRDVSDGTIYGVLSKPVSRGEYVLGNTLGGVAMLVSVWTLFGLVLALVGVVVGSPLGTLNYAVMASHVIQGTIYLAVALLLSTRFSPWGAAALTMLVVNGIGVVQGIAKLVEVVFHVTVPERVIDVLCFPFPVMNALNALTSQLTETSLSSKSVLPGFIHLIDYAAVVVVVTYLAFRRLELNRTAD